MKKYRVFSGFLALLLTLALALPAFAVDAPEAHYGAAVVVDGDNGDVLYDYNADKKMYPASITKVMTALLVLEAIDAKKLTLDTQLTASQTAISSITADSSNQNIKVGEVMTVEQLLYCELVASANETCNILAEAVAGSIDSFVEMMNARAAELGMKNTHFANPNGLQDANHYSTAYDIYLMCAEAMKHETFRTIVSTTDYTVPATNMSPKRHFYTTNALLSGWRYAGYTYDKAIGIKTGSTDAAGQCLASAAVDAEGRTFYCVVLNSQNVTEANGDITRWSFKASKELLEWAFQNFTRVTLMDENSVMREVPVTLSEESDAVIVQPSGSLEATLPSDYDASKAQFQIDLPASVEAPVEKGDKVGTVTLVYNGEEYGSLDLVAADSVARSQKLYYIQRVKDFFGNRLVQVLIIALVVLIMVLVIRHKLLSHGRGRYSGSSRRYGRHGRTSVGGYSGRRRR